MTVEERVRAAVDGLDVRPREVHVVVAEGRRRRRRARRVGGVLGAVATAVVIAVLASAVSGPSTDRAVPPATGPSATRPSADDVRVIEVDRREPPVRLAGTSADGTALDVADLRGQVVVLRLWGSWCKPCLEDAALVDDLGLLPGVEVLGVAFDEPSRAGFEATEDDLGVSFPSIFNPGDDALRGLGAGLVRGAPTTLVLDHEGRVAAIALGQLEPGTSLDQVISDLSDEPPDPSWPLPTLLTVVNATRDPVWVTFSNSNRAQLRPGRDLTLASAQACSSMPLTATAPDGTVLGSFDEECSGQTWTITADDPASR